MSYRLSMTTIRIGNRIPTCSTFTAIRSRTCVPRGSLIINTFFFCPSSQRSAVTAYALEDNIIDAQIWRAPGGGGGGGGVDGVDDVVIILRRIRRTRFWFRNRVLQIITIILLVYCTIITISCSWKKKSVRRNRGWSCAQFAFRYHLGRPMKYHYFHCAEIVFYTPITRQRQRVCFLTFS